MTNKFSISIPNADLKTMVAALENHGITFTATWQENKKFYYIQFELTLIELFELGGTYYDYKRIDRIVSKKK